MAVATARAKTARPPFNKQLVLVRHFADLLGGDFDALLARLAETAQGRDANGRSHFFRALASMNGVKVSRDDLARYDANILSHEAAIGARREDFRLTYFQYAACLFTELYLDRLTHDRTQPLRQIRQSFHHLRGQRLLVLGRTRKKVGPQIALLQNRSIRLILSLE